jgi:hypothetical protein
MELKSDSESIYILIHLLVAIFDITVSAKRHSWLASLAA